ncbi:sodium- and chloride-dependent creatine transporter 1-like [Strongylocentrotus purpuratus]|uniref:Transporter n=1 Tax=Strongylocentrotus purpuratus TaxID=7668 RepID=A0A7M7NJ63_STRPU|nr:sodium- and chloride-dependent creatine transporter 1-like [Strongylocentrotus purpuratus]
MRKPTAAGFVVVEGFVTTIVDIFPNTLLKGYRREFFCAGCCLFFCMAGIPMVTYGGMFIFQLFDFYAASGFVLLWVALCESLVIGWVYGGNRFMQDIINMIGKGWIKPYMLAAWMFMTPLFAGTIFIYSIVYYKPLTYEDDYVYPWWGYMLGWFMALSSILTIPVVFIYQFVFVSKGTLMERWVDGTTSRVPEIRQDGPLDKKDHSYGELELR